MDTLGITSCCPPTSTTCTDTLGALCGEAGFVMSKVHISVCPARNSCAAFTVSDRTWGVQFDVNRLLESVLVGVLPPARFKSLMM